MNKKLKIFGYILLGIIGILYLMFLLLPFFINVNNYIPLAQEIVKTQLNMDLEINNPKLITTPFLETGIKADGLKLSLSDGSPVIETDKIRTKLFLPSALLLTVKLSDIDVKNPKITLDTNPQATQYKLVSEIEDMLNRINSEPKDETAKGWFNPEWIRIKIPNIKIHNYNIAVNDKKNNHSLTLKGDELRLGYFNGKTAKIKTYAYLLSDDKTNLTININWNTFFPQAKKEVLDADDDKAEKIEIPFVNIVEIYQHYDLQAHINSKLKLRKTRNNNIKAFGCFNIENLTLKLANYNLPKCYFHSKISGRTANIDTNFYVTPDEKTSILGKIDISKPSVDLHINSDKIHFSNLIMFSKAILDSFGIRNDFNNLKGQGYIQANTYIKTNFKKLKSDGEIIIRDGSLVNNTIGLLVTGTNSDLIFDNNIFKINNTKLFIGGKPLTITGTIDNKSIADISVQTQNMPIVGLYNALAPSDTKNNIKMSSGNISLNAKINGKLQKSLSSVQFNLSDLGINTPDNSIKINNGSLSITALYDLKEKIIKGNLTNKNFSFNMPALSSTIKDSLLSVDFNNENIKLNPTSLLINNASSIKINGFISDYSKSPVIGIDGNGTLLASDLRKFAGSESEPYIDAKGTLPIKFKLTGNDKKQFLVMQILSNPKNLITPVYFKSLIGKQCITQVKINYKGDRLNIKDTGLYITHNPFTDDFSANMSGAESVIKAHGTFAKLDTISPRINILKLDISKELDGTIYAIKRSKFNLNGGCAIFGAISNPLIYGRFSVDNVDTPSLLTKIKSAGVDFNGHSMKLFGDDINLNGSDLQVEAFSNFEFSPVTKLFKIDIQSNDFNVDKVMQVSEAAVKVLPQTQQKNTAATAKKQEELPIEATGRFLFKNIKTGNITLTNTRGRISFAHNILNIHPMMTNAFKGVVRGKIATNVLTGEIDMDLKGHNINAEQALADAANTKDAISGTTSFEMKANLKGSTYEEQMKNLKGFANFKIINGGYGPIGKIENMILAENIRNSQFFQTALGGIISNIATIDTAHFSELKGTIKFKNGKAILAPITSQGNVMCLHIAGDFDLLKNEADMKVRGRLGSFLSNMLGPISALNPVNLVKATPGINVVMAKAFTLFTVAITPEEMRAIPDFNKNQSDLAATKFQIVLKGDAAKPLAMIKSFKWLALQSDIDNAQNFTDNMPEEYLLADPTTPEAQAAAAAKAKEDAKLINRVKRKLKK